MNKKDDVELKKSLATLVSSLIQKSVLSKSSEYYLVKPITKPEVAHPRDKTKPKRALILMVSAVSAFVAAPPPAKPIHNAASVNSGIHFIHFFEILFIADLFLFSSHRSVSPTNHRFFGLTGIRPIIHAHFCLRVHFTLLSG